MSKILQLQPIRCKGKLKESHWVDDEIIAQPKLDGVRYLLHTGEDSDGKPFNRFTSRRISTQTGRFCEKTDNFPHIRDTPLVGLGYTVLDGEIILAGGDCDSYDVTRVTGCSAAKAIHRQKEWGWVHYAVWDILLYKGEDLRHQPWWYRQSILKRLLGLKGGEGSIDSSYIYRVRTVRKKKKAFFENELANYKEGIILKHVDGAYHQRDWIKVKGVDTYDVVITGYHPARKYTEKRDGTVSLSKRYINGWIGSLEIGQYQEGELVDVGRCDGINEEVREYISRNKDKCLHRPIEIKANKCLESGKFRHGRFIKWRPDKNAEQCVKED